MKFLIYTEACGQPQNIAINICEGLFNSNMKKLSKLEIARDVGFLGGHPFKQVVFYSLDQVYSFQDKIYVENHLKTCWLFDIAKFILLYLKRN